MSVIEYLREVITCWLLDIAMKVATKRMRYYIARGLAREMRAYADELKPTVTKPEPK